MQLRVTDVGRRTRSWHSEHHRNRQRWCRLSDLSEMFARALRIRKGELESRALHRTHNEIPPPTHLPVSQSFNVEESYKVQHKAECCGTRDTHTASACGDHYHQDEFRTEVHAERTHTFSTDVHVERTKGVPTLCLESKEAERERERALKANYRFVKQPW